MLRAKAELTKTCVINSTAVRFLNPLRDAFERDWSPFCSVGEIVIRVCTNEAPMMMDALRRAVKDCSGRDIAVVTWEYLQLGHPVQLVDWLLARSEVRRKV